MDSARSRALLYAAIREGLVDDDPHIGDGFVRMTLEHPPSDELVTEAFEQLVLGGKVYLPLWVPHDWEGAPFTDEVFVPLDTSLEENLVAVAEYPAEAISGILKARGVRWTEEETTATLQEFLSAVRQWEVESGKSFSHIDLLNIFYRAGLGVKVPTYSERELALWKAVDAAYNAARPIFDAMQEYRTILTESIRLSALSSVPVSFNNRASYKLMPTDGTTTHYILKITCRNLGRTPTRPTLSETIALAASGEARALREQLAVWVDALENGEFQNLNFILEEIREAQQSLTGAHRLSKVAEFATWVGVSSLAATPFLPPAGAAGVVATIVGGMATFAQKRAESRARWAMFGHLP